MSRVQNVLMQYTDSDGPIPGRRQVNARLPVEDFGQLLVLCKHYKVTKSRLASDLLAAAVNEAFDNLVDLSNGMAHEDLNAIVDHLREEEENAR